MSRTTRSLIVLGAGAGVVAVVALAAGGRGVLADLFGWPGTWGTGGNMVAWIICGAIGGAWLHGKEQARHLQKMAQAARHHKELMAQAAVHHQELKAHVSLQLAEHCADIKDHVTQQVAGKEQT